MRKRKDAAEIIAEKYLESLSPGCVTFLREDPPDFSINASIGVEVTFLLENFFQAQKPEALRTVDTALQGKLRKVLESFNDQFTDKTFYVILRYKRPMPNTWAETGLLMRNALRAFLSAPSSGRAHIKINEMISLELVADPIAPGRTFIFFSALDSDRGGWLGSLYTKNILHCIAAKSERIMNHKARYSHWWLLLVDTLGPFHFLPHEVERLRNDLSDLGAFSKLILLDPVELKAVMELP